MTPLIVIPVALVTLGLALTLPICWRRLWQQAMEEWRRTR